MGKKMIYNNPSYSRFKNRKPNIEILHNIYKMYKYTKSSRDTPSFHWYEMIKIPGGGVFWCAKICAEKKKYNEFIQTYKKPIKKQRIKE